MKDILKFGGILFLITLITGTLLGSINSLTAPIIAQKADDARLDSIHEVVPSEIINELQSYEILDSTVTNVTSYQTTDGTYYAVSASPKGYGGEIDMMIGVCENLEITGVIILDMSETAGLGDAVRTPEFLAQFLGIDSEIQGITGATKSTNAVKLGVSDAIDTVQQIMKGAIT